tara:strand:+ start:9397 stop:11469 length:2073 start_codon:yes stop_codon:yes gene_type:complete
MVSQSANPTSEPHRLQLDAAVIGGGFAGVFCGKALCEKLGSDAEKSALISDRNYMVFQPMLAEVAGGSLSPRHVVNPIRMLCRGMRVFKGEVTGVDLEAKELHVNTGHFSSGVTINFEHLVIAMGAQIDLSRVPGMPEHALLMQNVGDAMILRATIISRIEEANVEARPEVRERLLTFVVVGGGFSGVETAGEVLDMLHEVAKYYHGVPKEELRVVLIHSRGQILSTLSNELGGYAERKLRKRGLEIRLNERVKAVTATKVYLQSGDVIETTTVVSTVGNAPHPLVRTLCDRYDLPNLKGRIQTTPNLQVPGYDFLWAAGDCAAVPLANGEEGQLCPQTAQFAMRQGQTLAENLERAMKGKPLKPFTFRGLGELASIGHQTAVANVFGLRFSGFLAWWMWRTVYLSKLPGLDRKVRVAIEWTLDVFFSRDINLLNPRYSRVFREVHLEPGDRLFTHGEPAFSLYVVKEGQIELRDGDTVVRTIQPGDFFGERALVHGGGYHYDAVSPGCTELLSVSGDVILPFFRASRRLGRVLAKTTAQYSATDELHSVEEKLDPAILGQVVSEVMRTDIASLSPEQTVRDGLDYFRERRFSAYPLVGADNKLVGVISRETFFDFLKRGDVSNDTKLERIERMHLPICRDRETVSNALEQMIRAGRYKCLVTDDDNQLLGILTVMDLLGESASHSLRKT